MNLIKCLHFQSSATQINVCGQRAIEYSIISHYRGKEIRINNWRLCCEIIQWLKMDLFLNEPRIRTV